MHQLNEEDAVCAFAKAWNRLEPDGFLELLAPDARYASQWVFDELVGLTAIAEYLRGKMRTIRALGDDPESRVRVEIGRTAGGLGGRPCAFVTQGSSRRAAVLFEVSDNSISRYDLCIPQILDAVGTGIFPIRAADKTFNRAHSSLAHSRDRRRRRTPERCVREAVVCRLMTWIVIQ